MPFQASRRSSVAEVFPVGDAVVIADERKRRQRTWRSGLFAQVQAGFVWETIGFA